MNFNLIFLSQTNFGLVTLQFIVICWMPAINVVAEQTFAYEYFFSRTMRKSARKTLRMVAAIALILVKQDFVIVYLTLIVMLNRKQFPRLFITINKMLGRKFYC